MQKVTVDGSSLSAFKGVGNAVVTAQDTKTKITSKTGDVILLNPEQARALAQIAVTNGDVEDIDSAENLRAAIGVVLQGEHAPSAIEAESFQP